MHRSLVICPRTISKDSLEKKRFMKICFVHVDFSFTEKLAILLPFVFFFIMSFTDIWLQNDYLVEKIPEK